MSGLFVDDALGPIPGTLPLSAIALEGTAADADAGHRGQLPLLLDRLRRSDDLRRRGRRYRLQQGQGMHGSFSRADTRNVMGAAGPSFRAGFDDPAPASNADLGKTIAHLLGLKIPDKGKLVGRVLTEALPNGARPPAQTHIRRSEPDAAGRVTVLKYQTVGETRYFDAAGYPGRTLGLTERSSNKVRRR